MILPSKALSPNRALVTLGSHVIEALDNASVGVSSLWQDVREVTASRTTQPVTFDWFVLCLDFLFAIGAIEATSNGTVRAVSR